MSEKLLGGLAGDHVLRPASWIWPLGVAYQDNTYAQLRRDFELKSVPRRAPFFISADQMYVLHVNGQYVGRGPARGFQATWAFDEYDLARHLRPGKNWISIEAYNSGISNFQYLFEWMAGLICGGRWGRFEIVSDGSWRSRVSPAHRPDVIRVSVQMGLQEQVDARLDDQSWIHSPRPPKGWPAGSAAVPFGSPPWHSLEGRGIPNLTSNLLPYQAVVGAAEGRCAKGYDDTPNIVAPLREELAGLSWRQAEQAGRVRGDWLELKVPAAGAGRFSATVVDLGTLGVGALVVEAGGAAGGELVDFHFSELLTEAGGPVVPAADKHSVGINMASRLVLKPGRTRHAFMQIMGHRYVTIVARDSRKPLALKLSLRETRYPLEVKGRFDCSDAVLNDIHRISARTQQVCMLDAYVDTPWREQAQWWGDAQVQARNTFHLADDGRLLERGLRIIGRQQLPNGLTFAHAPTNCQRCVIPAFSAMWGLTFHDHYWQTGRTDVFRSHLEKIDRLVEYFEGEGRDESGLLRYDPRYWHYVDWAEVNTPQTTAPINLWYMRMLEVLAELAEAAGLPERGRQWLQIRRKLARQVTEHYWDQQTGLWRDGTAGKQRQRYSVHSQTLALMNNLLPKRSDDVIANGVLPFLKGQRARGATPSSFWATYVYGEMIRRGHAAEVVRHIRQMYAMMIPHGGTWETFEFRPGGHSVSHAWSAHPLQHLASTLGGVRQTAVGWSRIRFEPLVTLAEVDRARVRVPTPLGLVDSNWRRDSSGRVKLSVKIPPKMVAEVILPDGRRETLKGGRGQWEGRSEIVAE